MIIGDEKNVVDQLVGLGGSDASIRLEDGVFKVSAPPNFSAPSQQAWDPSREKPRSTDLKIWNCFHRFVKSDQSGVHYDLVEPYAALAWRLTCTHQTAKMQVSMSIPTRYLHGSSFGCGEWR